MGIFDKLKAYSFIDFRLGNKDPKGNYIAEVMKEVPRNSPNHISLKKKIDSEIGFSGKKSRGMPYPTLIKYLALALEDIENADKQ